jgi:hypothetical protein
MTARVHGPQAVIGDEHDVLLGNEVRSGRLTAGRLSPVFLAGQE